METTKLNFFNEVEKIETEEERRKRIITECKESESMKKWYLTVFGTKSVEKAFHKEKYWDLHVKAVRRKEEKQKEFENKEIKYLADLLKKLKKIFNKAKKENDLKQLKYLNQKISNLMKDKNYIRIQSNGKTIENKICRDFGKIEFEVSEIIRLQGEN